MSPPTPRTSSARNEVRTVAPALMAMGRSDQLTGHLERARANGVKKEEIGELITAMTAGRIAKQVFEEKKS